MYIYIKKNNQHLTFLKVIPHSKNNNICSKCRCLFLPTENNGMTPTVH